MNGYEIFTITLKAFGGLALFLYGMTMLSGNLEKLSSGRMEKILESLTSNVIKSVLLGTLVTAVVQSSSATTVIVVGLVNAGILKLSNAIGVIMGANIGTTVTGQILRLIDLENNPDAGNVLKLFSPGTIAPLVAILGLACYMLSKKDSGKNIGEILLGLGILFTGMLSMTDAVKPLSELEGFRRLFETLQNPFLGVLAGIIITILLQSSSASVGILQAISTTGVLTFSAAFPIILGQNIGTTSTSMISAIGATKGGKRTAIVHVYFNIIGTVLFMAVLFSLKAVIGFKFWNDAIDMGGIANFHTLFNIAVTIFFIPFTKMLEKLAMLTYRDEPEEETGSEDVENINLNNLDDRLLKSPALAVFQSFNTAVCMGRLALHNYSEGLKLFTGYDEKKFEHLLINENNLDRMEDRLNSYLVKITECELTDYESRRVTVLLHLTSEFERIGDYTMNIAETAQKLHKSELKFSENAVSELRVITSAVEEIISMAVDTFEQNDLTMAYNIEPLEETIDYLNETLKSRHIERLKNGRCVIETGINFLDMLVNLERIADHCSNIAVYIIGGQKNINDEFYHHEYIEDAHSGENKEYRSSYDNYMKKYAV